MSATPVRHPAVAGRFYPRDPTVLRDDVLTYLSQASGEPAVHAQGCIVPHAGYIYSGHIAGAVFARLEVPELCIVLCPNHTGKGRPLAIMSEGVWDTPLGSISLDSEFAAAFKRRFPELEEDAAAHLSEHAIEVELPFLQLRQPRLEFVPVALGTGRFETLAEFGFALADVIGAQKRNVLIVASSDMNHYESDEITRIKDHSAIEAILRLEARELYRIVTEQNVSMCGFGPAIVMLTAVKQLGATSTALVKYATSGDISGDRNSVVGYAGIMIR